MRLSGGSRMCVWVLVARFCARNSARAVRFVHLGREWGRGSVISKSLNHTFVYILGTTTTSGH